MKIISKKPMDNAGYGMLFAFKFPDINVLITREITGIGTVEELGVLYSALGRFVEEDKMEECMTQLEPILTWPIDIRAGISADLSYYYPFEVTTEGRRLSLQLEG